MKLLSLSESDTQRFGIYLANFLSKRDIVALCGQLGAGKTMFIKGLAKGLGFSPKKVTSSSFVIVRVYRTKKFPLYHFDLYRIKNNKQIYHLGYQEYLYADGVCVIEWAQKIKRLLYSDYLEIKIDILNENRRELNFISHGRRYKHLLNRLRRQLKDEYSCN